MNTYHLLYRIREDQYIICSNIRALTKEMVCEIAENWLVRRINIEDPNVIILNSVEFELYIQSGGTVYNCYHFDELK